MRSMALVKVHDTHDLDFSGYRFEIRGWENGYLKLEDTQIFGNRLPMVNEGSKITKFESVYELMKYVRDHE